jgi:MFS family permease
MDATREPPSIIQTLRGASRPVWLLLAGTLINRLGTFLQIYLVLYLTHRGFSVAEAGLALGAYGGGSVAGVLLGGSISDRLGYRWTIVGSMMGAGLLTASLVHLTSLPTVIAVATATGVAAQASRPATAALLVELTPEKQHVMVFALYRLAFNLGTIAGPLLGALLITYSYSLMFYGDAITSIGFALFALTLPHSVDTPATADASGATDTGKSSKSYLTVLRDARYALFMLALFLNAVVYIQSTAVLPLQVTASGHSAAFYAALLSINAFVVTCLELPFTKFVQRMPSKLAVALGIGLVGVGMNLYLAGPAVAMFVVATLVWTIGEMTGTPTASAYPGRVAPSGMRSRYIAAAAFSMQIGYAVGPVLGAAVWAVWPSGVWWLCGLLTVAAVLATLLGMTQSAPGPATGGPAEKQPTPQAADAVSGTE